MSTIALTTEFKDASATADACAKINLTLEILSRREDGYHELRSLVIGVDLRDDLRASISREPGLILECSDPTISGPHNLASQGVIELARHCHLEPAVRIELHKSIPIGAGLGGGSSDAATALRICNHLWGVGLSDVELSTLGARVGSDVPLFFALPSAIMTGRGERVESVPLKWGGWVLLAFAGPAVSTADVYRRWRPSDASRLPKGTALQASQASTAEELSDLLANHLEPAVFRSSPTVAKVHDKLSRLGHGPWRASGAGSALFRLYDDKESADEIAREIQDLEIGVTTTVVSAPTGPGPVVSKEN